MRTLTLHSKQPSRVFAFMIVLLLLLAGLVAGQEQRNPVLEFCTGTWCQWCPCGDDVILNEILPAVPNAIILAYHGAGNDPFRNFHGNSIISQLGLNAYPTGIIDRVSGVQGRGAWRSLMLNRQDVMATVRIELVERVYNPFTREFSATLDFTAMTDLSGEYRYNILLVEDHITYPQTSNNVCTPGTSFLPDYVHDWLVRDIMNGATGDELTIEAWTAGNTIRKTFEYSVPDFEGFARDIDPNACRMVVKVYRVGSPMNSNAEIQQAESWPLLDQGYAASLESENSEALGLSTEPVRFSASVTNEGQLLDAYHLSIDFDGPEGWQPSFTTLSGTHQLGDTDLLNIPPGVTLPIDVDLDANGIEGYGKVTLRFFTDHFIADSVEFYFTTFGVELLIVDDDSSDYENYLVEIAELNELNYGLVRSQLVPPAQENIDQLDAIFWNCATEEPTLDDAEQEVLRTFLDHGGKLFLSGVDIAYELGDANSPYRTDESLAFLTDYLHTGYVQRENDGIIASGIAGDALTDNMPIIGLTGGSGARTINPQENQFANQIEPADEQATPIFHVYQNPDNVIGIRAVHEGTSGQGKVVFTTFGFETINKATDRELFAQRVLTWFDIATSVEEPRPQQTASTFVLRPNYPNPFNPGTRIAFELPGPGNNHVTLSVYNQLGQRVRVLVNEARSAGYHEVFWDGTDDRGKMLASGIYYYELQVGEQRDRHKMLLLR